MRINPISGYGTQINSRQNQYIGAVQATAPVKNENPWNRYQLHLNIQKIRKELSEIPDRIPNSVSASNFFNPASARSSSSLNLQVASATKTVATSSEEINSTSTSFSPRGPSYSGSSTSLATVDGIYDGSNGIDELTVLVVTGGIVGVMPILQLDIKNSLGETVDSVTENFYQADSEIQLQNGIILSFGSGSLAVGDQFSFDVFDSVGEVVSETNSFNGTRNNHPGFEYGNSVSNGSFEINGEEIIVIETDSIQDVLAKINESNANVSATFETFTERIKIESTIAGSSSTIVLENDTSGFLNSTKLSDATIVQGQDSRDDFNNALSFVPSFDSVNSGTIFINSTSILIDVDNDSLNDIIERINNSSANVTASLDHSQRLNIVNNDGESSLSLVDDDTNFLASVGIDAGSIDATKVESEARSVSPSLRRSFSEQAKKIFELIDEIFDVEIFPQDEIAEVNLVRNEFRKGIESFLKTKTGEKAKAFGVDFDFSDKDSVVNFDLTSQHQLQSAINRNSNGVNQFFLGSSSTSGSKGLFAVLTDVAKRVDEQLNSSLTSYGYYVDVTV